LKYDVQTSRVKNKRHKRIKLILTSQFCLNGNSLAIINLCNILPSGVNCICHKSVLWRVRQQVHTSYLVLATI